MKANDITTALDSVGKKWTRQMKTEEKRPSARQYRHVAWSAPARVPLKQICYKNLPEAWDKASDGGRLPTHWRQLFYVVRPICDGDPDSDRPLRDTTFKNILEDYLKDYAPGWDVLRGARGVFKEPHAAENDNGLAMSTLNVRNYQLTPQPEPYPGLIARRFPTHGATNRIAAALICEKEGMTSCSRPSASPNATTSPWSAPRASPRSPRATSPPASTCRASRSTTSTRTGS